MRSGTEMRLIVDKTNKEQKVIEMVRLKSACEKIKQKTYSLLRFLALDELASRAKAGDLSGIPTDRLVEMIELIEKKRNDEIGKSPQMHAYFLELDEQAYDEYLKMRKA